MDIYKISKERFYEILRENMLLEMARVGFMNGKYEENKRTEFSYMHKNSGS